MIPLGLEGVNAAAASPTGTGAGTDGWTFHRPLGKLRRQGRGTPWVSFPSATMAKTSQSQRTSRRSGRSQRSDRVCIDCPAWCCHTLLIPIDRPRTKADFDYYRWHLHYDTVRLAIRSHRWYEVVEGRCIYLDERNLCSIYERRPEICRRHSPSDCERHGSWYDVLIERPEELDAFVERERKRRARRRRRGGARKAKRR